MICSDQMTLPLIKREYSSILRATLMSDILEKYYEFFGTTKDAINLFACDNELIKFTNEYLKDESPLKGLSETESLVESANSIRFF